MTAIIYFANKKYFLSFLHTLLYNFLLHTSRNFFDSPLFGRLQLVLERCQVPRK